MPCRYNPQFWTFLYPLFLKHCKEEWGFLTPLLTKIHFWPEFVTVTAAGVLLFLRENVHDVKTLVEMNPFLLATVTGEWKHALPSTLNLNFVILSLIVKPCRLHQLLLCSPSNIWNQFAWSGDKADSQSKKTVFKYWKYLKVLKCSSNFVFA